MRAVIEKDVLQDGFSGLLPDIFVAAYSSILGVTPAIVEQYLSINDGAGMSRIWFDKVFSTESNYCLVSPESIAKYNLQKDCLLSNYIGAAFHNSGAMIVKSAPNFNTINPTKWGVTMIEATSFKLAPGDSSGNGKIAEIISLIPGGHTSPSVIEKYFRQENRIFIFDKSINSAGRDLIIEITKFCTNNCKIIVMSNFNNHTSRGLLDRQELQKDLNKNKFNGTIQCLQADRKTLDRYHDRFIFLGDRFQLLFTSGLDSFGRSPLWCNSDGEIIIHCVHSSKAISKFSSTTGNLFELRSKG